MTEIKFIKDHPSKRFKKGDVVKMPTENIDAWIKSGYAALPNEVEENVGNLPTSSENGGVDSKSKSNKQEKFGGKKKNKKRNRK